MSKTVSEIMAQAVDLLVEQRINKAPFDKTYAGIISGILFEPDTDIKDSKFGTYKVRYNNTEKTFKLNDGIVHEVGERVMVYVPENNPNRMFVEPVITDKKPNKIVYDKENNKFIEHRETLTDEKTYDIENEYAITFQERDGKEVVVIQCSDGYEAIIENYEEYKEWFSDINISDTGLIFSSGNRSVITQSGEKKVKTYTYEFQKDNKGRITQITDMYGHITTITRS